MQRARDLEPHLVDERLEELGLVFLGETAVTFRDFGLLRREAELVLDLLRELVAAERLLPQVDRLPVTHHVDRHDRRADVDHRDVLVFLVFARADAHQLESHLGSV
jgi:hypothetical protein